jgi:DNA-directed RNA polymerase specialized sigma24 family protein
MSDGGLLGRVRAGDDAAYEALRRRHEQAARRLAQVLVPPADVDDVVAETFNHVLEVTRDGGGPSGAFRLYALTALRSVCSDRLSARRDAPAGDPGQPGDPEPCTDPALAGEPLMAKAFRALPDLWMAVLWHTEVDGESPAAAGPVLGLSPKGVTALKARAMDGLSEVYLRLRFAEADVTWPGCKQVARRLAAFQRGAVSRRDRAMVTEHLSHCNNCGAIYDGLAELNQAPAGLIAPVFLGAAAGSCLSGEAGPGTPAAGEPAAADAAARGVAAGGAAAGGVAAGGAAAGGAAAGGVAAGGAAAGSHGRAVGHARRAFRSPGWIAACVAVVALAAVLFGLAVSGGGSPAAPARHDPPPQAAAPREPARTAPAQPRQKRSAAPRPDRVSSRAAPAISPSAAATGPGGAPGPAQPTVRLSATVTVSSSFLVFQQVAFTVTDTGGAGTGGLTALLTFPPGTLLSSVSTDDSNGWTCQPTATGTSCQHQALPAGGEAHGAISLSALGSATCSQPIQLTMVSGSARAVAQYPQAVHC